MSNQMDSCFRIKTQYEMNFSLYAFDSCFDWFEIHIGWILCIDDIFPFSNITIPNRFHGFCSWYESWDQDIGNAVFSVKWVVCRSDVSVHAFWKVPECFGDSFAVRYSFDNLFETMYTLHRQKVTELGNIRLYYAFIGKVKRYFGFCIFYSDVVGRMGILFLRNCCVFSGKWSVNMKDLLDSQRIDGFHFCGFVCWKNTEKYTDSEGKWDRKEDMS